MTQIVKPDVAAVRKQVNAEVAAADAICQQHITEARSTYEQVHNALGREERAQIYGAKQTFDQGVAAADQIVSDKQDAVAQAAAALKAAQAALAAAKADFKEARHDRATTVRSLTKEFNGAVSDIVTQATDADREALATLKGTVASERAAVYDVQAAGNSKIWSEQVASATYRVWQAEDTAVRVKHGFGNVWRTLGQAFSDGFAQEGVAAPKLLEDRVVKPAAPTTPGNGPA